MKKKWLTASSLVAVSALSILGTKAYLTDTDQDTNTMTIGNIEIDQMEYQRIGESHTLEEFAQNKTLYPVVGEYNFKAFKQFYIQNDSKTITLDKEIELYNMDGVQDKLVFVKNTGENDIYYRTIIAVECPKGLENKIHINATKSNNFDWNDDKVGNQLFGNGNEKVIYTVIDGVRYAMYEVTDTNPLDKGTYSTPSLLQVYLDKTTTNEDVEKLGDTLDILVMTQAAQADTALSANEVLDQSFGNIGAYQNPWIEGKTVSNITEMQAALASGEHVIMTSDIETNSTMNLTKGGLIDGGNNTLKLNNSTGDSKVILTNGGTIKNINIQGGFRGIYVETPNEDIILDNVIVDGTYALNVNTAEYSGKSLTVKDSVLKGWTSYSDTFSSATFENCEFGEGSTGQANFKPYMTTTLINCNFETGFKLDGQEITGDEKIILKNCTINGILIESKDQLLAHLHADQQGDINKIEIQ